MEGIFGAKPKTKISKGVYEFTKSQVEEELAKRHDKNRHTKEEPLENKTEIQSDATTELDPLLNFLDLMDKVYGTNEQEIKEGEKLEKEYQKPPMINKPRQITPPPKPAASENTTKFKSVFEIEEEPYGPQLPARLKIKAETANDNVIVDNVVNARRMSKYDISGSESESEEEERERSRSKKQKKEHKKRHKEKKSKHKKKHKENKVLFFV